MEPGGSGPQLNKTSSEHVCYLPYELKHLYPSLKEFFERSERKL